MDLSPRKDFLSRKYVCRNCLKELPRNAFYWYYGKRYTECKECRRIKNELLRSTRKCLICKIEFKPKSQNQKYCCSECAKKSNSIEYKLINGTGYLKLRFEILKRDNFTCQYCGRKAPDVILHVDHIITRKGVSESSADNRPENLTTACKECNLGKSDVLLEQKKYLKDNNQI